MNVGNMIEQIRTARDAGQLDPATANTVIAILREHPELVKEEES